MNHLNLFFFLKSPFHFTTYYLKVKNDLFCSHPMIFIPFMVFISLPSSPAPPNTWLLIFEISLYVGFHTPFPCAVGLHLWPLPLGLFFFFFAGYQPSSTGVGKLWRIGKTQTTACFCIACKLRMVFTDEHLKSTWWQRTLTLNPN